ncbi:hypothetical protein WR25_24992 [Diploscapter pachys]|uniref:Uncharacterized protein n=1 Tax=Diploscapter pachys TaxID=2018661 RepID=A0A2A2K2C9_9BILA|nr:hypothetical protein WR25_24992 [Diploscapter pachys]
MAMRDELLGTVKSKAVAGAFGGHRDPVAMLGAFVDRQRGDRVARDDAGEPAVRLRAALQRLDRRDRGGEEGGGGQVAPDLFQHHARFDMAQAQAALRLGHQHAVQAHFGKLLPQVARKAGGVVRVAKRAQVADGRMFGDEVLRRIAQHRLFVIEVEGHFDLSKAISLWERVG